MLDVVNTEKLPATYTLLIDSSQSMSRRMDFVREAATTLAGKLRPAGQDYRRAVLENAGARDGADR